MPKDSDTERMWLKWAARLQFIAQAGLTYSENAFDRERFAAIRETAAEIMSANTPETFERIDGLFSRECGYQTPKLDTRAAVFEGQDTSSTGSGRQMGAAWRMGGCGQNHL